jgi:hypothetical protein
MEAEGRVDLESTPAGERVSDLRGKTVAELCDFEHGEWFPVIREELRRRFPGVSFVEYPVFGATHGHDERQVIADLPEKLHEYGVDAVISGVGL